MNQLSNLMDNLPDLNVQIAVETGRQVYSIYVEVDETIGHYSDWLGLGSSKTLRKRNQIKRARSLQLGEKLFLPDMSPSQIDRFEQLRTDYHQVLSENLKESFELAGLEAYTVRNGDSLWELAQRRGFPLWLLYRINHKSLKTGIITTGQSIHLPVLKQR